MLVFIPSTPFPKFICWNPNTQNLEIGHLGISKMRPRFDPWVGKIPWRRKRLPIPVFWPGEFHGLCSPWGRGETDTTERLSLSLLMRFWGWGPGVIGWWCWKRRRDTEFSTLSLSKHPGKAMWAHSEKVTICNPTLTLALTRHQPCWHHDLGLLLSRTAIKLIPGV